MQVFSNSCVCFDLTWLWPCYDVMQMDGFSSLSSLTGIYIYESIAAARFLFTLSLPCLLRFETTVTHLGRECFDDDVYNINNIAIHMLN